MTPDALTAIREPCDIDVAEETAWSIIEQNGWIATPQLLFALKAWTKEIVEKRIRFDAAKKGL